jgi:hypothetical protein
MLKLQRKKEDEGGLETMSDEIRDQINDIIEGEIQNNINEYIEKEGKGFKGEELKVNVNQEELNKLVKVYKKLNKYRKSSLFAVQNMDNTEKIVSEMIAELKKDTKE